MFKKSIRRLALRYLKRHCAPFFSVWIEPIHQICSIDNCFVLDTSCLPFWERRKRVYISTNPFKPFENLELVRAFVYDGTRKNIVDVYGVTRDAEHLYVYLAFWDNERNRYLITSIDYLPDTQISFGRSLGSYPVTEIELNEIWDRYITLSRNEGNQTYNILNAVSAPSKLDKLIFRAGQGLYVWVNKSGLPPYPVWQSQIFKIAKDKDMLFSHCFSGCSDKYWRILYAQGYKAVSAFPVGTNPNNWDN